MTEKPLIDRYKPDPEGLDFAGFRQQGIDLLQQLSGKLWTDFNLHDPGITILEQLCYALTDLVYRIDFPVADHLTDEDGLIPFSKLGLFGPTEIFPNRAITCNDYRKIIFDALVKEIPEVNNVWVNPQRALEPDAVGLLDITLRLNGADADRSWQAVDVVKRIYAENRNLCEDLGSVKVAANRFYSLQGSVQIDNKREPAELMAEIYFRCGIFVAPSMKSEPIVQAIEVGKTLEQIFKGPLTDCGYINKAELDTPTVPVTLGGLIGIISAINGVSEITQLSFVDDDGKQLDVEDYGADLDYFPCLKFPLDQQSIRIKLFKNGREHGVELAEIRADYLRLINKLKAARRAEQNIKDCIPVPSGQFRNLVHYHSIQHYFPGVYGIGRFGVPDSYSTQRKAQAKQLKAYLVLFEQVMVNFLATVQQISCLYSADEECDRSYFYTLLKDDAIPGVETLYQGKDNASMEHIESKLAGIVKRYDNYTIRRNRVLDYLLSLYGEKFTQSSLRRFNYYLNPAELEQKVIENKIKFLKEIVELSANRSAGFNTQQKSCGTDNISGLERKITLLLGMKNFNQGYLTQLDSECAINIVEDNKPLSVDESRRRITLPITVLHSALDPEQYLIKKDSQTDLTVLSFRSKSFQTTEFRKVFQSESDAQVAKSDLCAAFKHLNIAGEGLYLIEHCLLRPQNGSLYKDLSLAETFYAFTISVMFSGWSARCSDIEFRKLAEETVRLNCPAHILPHCHWLSFEAMQIFEARYAAWLDVRRQDPSNAVKCDQAARALIEFLIDGKLSQV